MPRPILDESRTHPAIRDKVASHQQALVQAVMAAVQAHDVVVVGMGKNPFPKKARVTPQCIRSPVTSRLTSPIGSITFHPNDMSWS